MKHPTWNFKISPPNFPRALEKGTGSFFLFFFFASKEAYLWGWQLQITPVKKLDAIVVKYAKTMSGPHGHFKCYCLRKPGDMAKSRNMKVVQIYSFLVW